MENISTINENLFLKKNELLIKKKPSFIDGNQGQFVKLNTNSITIRMVPTITMWDFFAEWAIIHKDLKKTLVLFDIR